MTVLRAAFPLAITLAVLAALWRPGETVGLPAGLESRLLDLRFLVRGKRQPSGETVILAIDDRALTALGGFPISRSALATVVETVRTRGARVVAFDLLLTGGQPGDARLSDALGKWDRAILAVSLSKDAPPPDDALQSITTASAFSVVHGQTPNGPSGVLGPKARLATSTELGHVNVALERDGTLRRIPMGVPFQDRFLLPALPLLAARQIAGLDRADVFMDIGKSLKLGDRLINLDRDGYAILNFFGPSRTIPTFSLADADTAPIEGKAVFIGANARGYGDRFATPFDRELPGVEALATMAENLLSNTTLRRDALTWLIDIGLAGVFSAMAIWAASRAHLGLGSMGLGVVFLLGFGILQIAFHQGLWLDGATALAALAIGATSGFGSRQIMLRRRAANLAQYKSPRLVESLAAQSRPTFDGRMQNAAALFVDAAGFTGLSDRLGPEASAKFLKSFHAGIERSANACHGSVEQFAGDGAMIIFGLPEPSSEDAANALRCADLLFAEVETLSQAFLAREDEPLSIRIGAHYGEVVASVLGGAAHRHVTIIGTVVNAASRLQEVAKLDNVEMVVSADLIDAAASVPVENFYPLGAKKLRGLDHPLQVWARKPRQA